MKAQLTICARAHGSTGVSSLAISTSAEQLATVAGTRRSAAAAAASAAAHWLQCSKAHANARSAQPRAADTVDTGSTLSERTAAELPAALLADRTYAGERAVPTVGLGIQASSGGLPFLRSKIRAHLQAQRRQAAGDSHVAQRMDN
mmetsp:Transcript_17456/g.40519  ORF Transcript_17456/g.40519 Transcript_17456/m.40519 type:complete len:146 (-) Transcript_17456:281-718(-)